VHPSFYDCSPQPGCPNKKSAFTLVELLVVIGIIALLISILLPALSKAKESANQVKCLSNIRQIATGFFSYAQDNKGYWPFMAGHGNVPEDWVWWDPDQNDTDGKPRKDHVAEHGIGPYLNLSKNPRVLLCPSDSPENHVRGKPNAVYPFSYALNNLYTSEFRKNNPMFPPTVSNAGLFGNLSNGGPSGNLYNLIAAKITQVSASSDKILVFEESEATIDDGNGSLWCPPNLFHYTNLPAWRHDRKNYKDVAGELAPQDGTKIPNPEARGVVGFCDGHADFQPRTYILSKYHNIPNIGQIESYAGFAAWP
jgi:prepilin-type N-terminal cleavage/methylation domain-containing protein